MNWHYCPVFSVPWLVDSIHRGIMWSTTSTGPFTSLLSAPTATSFTIVAHVFFILTFFLLQLIYWHQLKPLLYHINTDPRINCVEFTLRTGIIGKSKYLSHVLLYLYVGSPSRIVYEKNVVVHKQVATENPAWCNSYISGYYCWSREGIQNMYPICISVETFFIGHVF